MGMLLSFVPKTPAPGRPMNMVGIEASIIIFPGVRYERSGNLEAESGKVSAQASSGDSQSTPKH